MKLEMQDFSQFCHLFIYGAIVSNSPEKCNFKLSTESLDKKMI